MNTDTGCGRAEDMPILHTFRGVLPKDFVGQIAYVFCLPARQDELDVEFRFGPRTFPSKEAIPPSLPDELRALCLKNYDMTLDEAALADLLSQLKTEIHTLAELNGDFIGGIHRQASVRHMYFSANEASKGCLPVEKISGSLKVTLLVFNVLTDETTYELIIRGRTHETASAARTAAPRSEEVSPRV